MRYVIALLPVIFLSGAAFGDIRTESVEYSDGETVLKGCFAYDDSSDAERPAVLVIHEWWGLNDFARAKARELAEAGYLAFACDMYGRGETTDSPERAAQLAGALRAEPALLRKRAAAALAALKGHRLADSQRTAAIGFSFGGGAALELARSGADVDGVVSFHGDLDTGEGAEAGKVKAAVLVLHGGDDPHVSDADLKSFMDEMRAAGADWQVNIYGGAVHGFTSPAAGDDPSSGAAYDEEAARRAWDAMRAFLEDIFGG